MKRLRGLVLYIFYLVICVELISTAILFFPRVHKRLLNVNSSSSWRIEYVRSYLIKHGLFPGKVKPSRYSFDRYDRTRGWDLKPNIQNLPVFDHKLLNSNSLGIRGAREYPFNKKPGTRRIVILGDSFTFGEDVNDDESYAYYLQQLVPPDVEVIDLGIHGYGHDQMLLKLKQEGLYYQPDLVMLGFFERDMDRNMLDFTSYAKPRYVLEKGRLRLTNVPVPTVRQVLISELFRFHFLDLVKIIIDKVRDMIGETADEEKEVTSAILDSMNTAARTAHSQFMLLDIPSVNEIFDGKPDADDDFLRSYSRLHQVPFLDPGPELSLSEKRGFDCNKSAHYCPRLNEHLAHIIYHYLQDSGWLKKAV